MNWNIGKILFILLCSITILGLSKFTFRLQRKKQINVRSCWICQGRKTFFCQSSETTGKELATELYPKHQVMVTSQMTTNIDHNGICELSRQSVRTSTMRYSLWYPNGSLPVDCTQVVLLLNLEIKGIVGHGRVWAWSASAGIIY